jgi:hypothetical protein
MPGVQDINRNDLGVMAAGAVAFIASFLPYYGVSYSGATVAGVHVGGGSFTVTAWHGYAVVGLLLIFAAAILIAVKTFATMPTMPLGVHIVAAILAGLGTLLVILRGFTYPHASFPGGSYGVKWGGYVLFVVGIVVTVFAILGMRESGEKMAWQSGGAPAEPPPSAPPSAPTA